MKKGSMVIMNPEVKPGKEESTAAKDHLNKLNFS